MMWWLGAIIFLTGLLLSVAIGTVSSALGDVVRELKEIKYK